MYEISKKTGEPARNADGTPKAKTSHTLNPVPCILYDNFYTDAYTCIDGAYGLANVAATVVTLAGSDAAGLLGKEHGGAQVRELCLYVMVTV